MASRIERRENGVEEDSERGRGLIKAGGDAAPALRGAHGRSVSLRPLWGFAAIVLRLDLGEATDTPLIKGSVSRARSGSGGLVAPSFVFSGAPGEWWWSRVLRVSR